MDINTASQTEWNGGTLTNIRIHTMREEIRACAATNELRPWLTLLEQMNHDLYGFQTTAQKKEIREKLKQLAEKINLHVKQSRFTKIKTKGIPAGIIDSLNDMQYQLDEIFHTSGLQTALKEDSGDAF